MQREDLQVRADRTVTNDRLVLRGWADADVEPFAELCADPRVMEHFPAPLSSAESLALLKKDGQNWDRDGFGLWAVELTDLAPTGPAAFIGFSGLARCDWLAPGAVEVGWRLAAEHWGHGYAPEAATLALAEAFLNLRLDEVVSFTVPANTRSQRVMEKIGMVREPDRDFDHPRVDPVRYPHLVRHVVWSITRADWLALHADHV
jgi:RimJ/RimL family protein N-acetyltransferase